MTIGSAKVGAATAATAAVTPLTPGVPAGLVATDLSILTVELKRTAAATPPTVTTPAGWTPIAGLTSELTGVAAATDVGTMSVAQFYRIGTYTGPSIVTTDANSAGAVIVAYPLNGGSPGTWDLDVLANGTRSGSDSTNGANATIDTASVLPTLAIDDVLLAGVAIAGDVGTVSAVAVTAAGVTEGASTTHVNAAVTTGTDSRLVVAEARATSAGAGGTGTVAYTNASSTTAHARILILREVPPLTVAGATTTPTAAGPVLTQVHNLTVAGATTTPTVPPLGLDESAPSFGPDDLVLTDLGAGDLEVTWTPTAGAYDHYVELYDDTLTLWDNHANVQSPDTFFGLTEGILWTVRVYSANAEGDFSPVYSEQSITLGAGAPVTLVVANATTTPTAASPTLTQVHQLAVNGASSTPTADNAGITQAHTLAPADASTTPTAAGPTLTQDHTLAVVSASSTPTAEAAGITQLHTLAPAGASSTPTADVPLLTQVHQLAVDNASSSPTADAAGITVASNLAPADAASTPTADAVSLTQVHNLTVAGATTTPTAEAAGISQAHQLAPADATTTPTADTVALTQVHNLAVAGATSSPTADAAPLSGAGTLGPADATSSPTADTVALVQAHNLVVASATTTPTAQAAGISQAHTLAPADATTVPTAGDVALTQAHTLAVDEALAFTAAQALAIVDNPPIELVVAGATMHPLAQSADPPARIRLLDAALPAATAAGAGISRARIRVTTVNAARLEARIPRLRARDATIDIVDLVDADL